MNPRPVSAANQTSEDLMNLEDLAIKLKISKRTIRRLNDAGKFPLPLRIGRSMRWRSSDIQSWLDERCPSRR